MRITLINQGSILFILLLISILFVLASCALFTSKHFEPAYEINLSREEVIIVLNDNKTEDKGVVIVLDSDKATEQEENQEEKQEENQEEQLEGNKAGESEVDFYFLLKGRSYFRHILRESQLGTYNLSGIIVTIEPIIITSDSVRFRINNYTTKALQEDDSDCTQEFEIIVSDIYYRS